MAGYVGQVRDGEYWTRCPFCGDSKRHSHKCHFSINLRTGLYNCHRCSAGGRFSSEETYALCCNFVWFINTEQGFIRKPQTTKYKLNATSFDFTMLETKVGRKITKNIVNNTLLYDIEKRGFNEIYFLKK